MASYPSPLFPTPAPCFPACWSTSRRKRGGRRNLRGMSLSCTEHLLICIPCYLCSGCVALGRKLTAISAMFSDLSCNLPRSSCFTWTGSAARMEGTEQPGQGQEEGTLAAHRSFQSCSPKPLQGVGEGNSTRLIQHGRTTWLLLRQDLRWTNPESGARQIRLAWQLETALLEKHELIFRSSKRPGQNTNFDKLIRTISTSKTTRARRWNGTAALAVLQEPLGLSPK